MGALPGRGSALGKDRLPLPDGQEGRREAQDGQNGAEDAAEADAKGDRVFQVFAVQQAQDLCLMVVGHDDDHNEQHQQNQGENHIGQHAKAVIRQDADQGHRRHGQGQDQKDQQNDPRQTQTGGRL